MGDTVARWEKLAKRMVGWYSNFLHWWRSGTTGDIYLIWHDGLVGMVLLGMQWLGLGYLT